MELRMKKKIQRDINKINSDNRPIYVLRDRIG